MHKKQFPNDCAVKRIEIGADPRHSQIFVFSDQSKPVGTLGVRVPLPDVDVELTDEARRRYAQDRPELQYAAQKLARDVSKPTERGELALKRVCRFLLGSGCSMWSFPRQKAPTTLRGYIDNDWAGCVRTVWSTSCSMLFHGQHLVGPSSTAHNVHVLTLSGTASSRVRFWSHTSLRRCSWKGMACRRGVGKIRDLHVQVLCRSWREANHDTQCLGYGKPSGLRHQAPGGSSDS